VRIALLERTGHVGSLWDRNHDSSLGGQSSCYANTTNRRLKQIAFVKKSNLLEKVRHSEGDGSSGELNGKDSDV